MNHSDINKFKQKNKGEKRISTNDYVINDELGIISG